MPLTQFQSLVFAAIAEARSSVSYLAGGAALHAGALGTRYSNDLDLFHTSASAANAAFLIDAKTLGSVGLSVAVLAEFEGFVKARISDGTHQTEVDWAHESAWRFLPLVPFPGGGVMLHPIDLAINKLIALAGRREPRDLVDVLYADEHILPFPALIWAVVEKNPGLNPASYLEQFRRRTLTPEDAAFLRMTGAYDVAAAAARFRELIANADFFIEANRSREPGMLLQDTRTGQFIAPESPEDWAHIRLHYGAPGGVVPRPAEATLRALSAQASDPTGARE